VDDAGKVATLFGVELNGKPAGFVFACAPLGTVLMAIRENEARAEVIGYCVVAYRTLVFCIAALVASPGPSWKKGQRI
jgi:branched-chain amino acid transport system permease protein